ncbi:hypothetical protein [Aeromicrobium sp.]|uniref:hypothetical protein n=1 Tax=Aeromicrobium sp. TaxID=1871063 RepID=UPI0035194404
MRRRSVIILSVLLTLPAGMLAATSPAFAATQAGGALTVKGLAGLVADDVHDRVFVGDGTAGTVQAADLSGKVVDKASVGGVRDLALSTDSTVLYASAWDSHEIVALDPMTLEEKARFSVPTDTGPRDVAFSGGKLWFSYGEQWDGNLGYLDPTTGEVTMDRSPGMVHGQVLLDASNGAPDRLAFGERDSSPAGVTLLDTSGDVPTVVAVKDSHAEPSSPVWDVDVVPDDTPRLLMNGNLRLAQQEEGVLGPDGTYPGGDRADVSPAGTVAVGNDNKVAIYLPKASRPVNTYASRPVWDLAWSNDESSLAIMSAERDLQRLTILDRPALTRTQLKASAPSSAPRAKALTVRGTLSSSTAFASPARLTVVRKDLRNPEGIALPPVSPARDGSWSFRTTPPVGGTVSYVVSFAGDAGHQGATATAKVAVSRNAPELTLTPRSTTYSYGKKATFTARLGSTYQNRTVEIWVDQAGKDVPRTRVASAKGTVRWTGTLRRNTVVSAVYAGDERTAPRTVSSTASTRVSLSSSILRAYKKARIDGQTYHVFHRRSAPVITGRMTPHSGRRARVDLQVRENGRWYALDSEYFELDKDGWVGVDLGSPGRTGVKARARLAYVRGGSGDSLNATTAGSWHYLYWTK